MINPIEQSGIDGGMSRKSLRVYVATPLGLSGRGGIDRLNDMIFEAVAARPELHVRLDRLVTRGQRGLFAAQYIFGFALMRLWFDALRGKVDLLHIHLSDTGSSYRKTILGAVADYVGVPYVVHLHGAVFEEFWSATSPYWIRAINRLFERSEHIIVLGKYWARVVGDRLPGVVHKISVIPNATPPSPLNQVPAKNACVRISFLGRLGQRKGTPQLIEALHRLINRKDWTATIAGDGEVEASRALVREFKLESKVNVPGWLDSAKTDDLLRNTDILVLPSFFENLPMVILEAFARGIPVVSTPVGAIPETVESGRNGLLVSVGDSKALADALNRLISDHEFRQTLGKYARRVHAERYEIGPYVKRIVEIWRCCYENYVQEKIASKMLDFHGLSETANLIGGSSGEAGAVIKAAAVGRGDVEENHATFSCFTRSNESHSPRN